MASALISFYMSLFRVTLCLFVEFSMSCCFCPSVIDKPACVIPTNHMVHVFLSDHGTHHMTERVHLTKSELK